ncbi:hypothetical protein HK100_006579 [Physocladia obscura]|uniref:Protein PNS1 n=1 Tax=Physocladia obscura TaxID=109957 RepID=A0AAD5XCK2_9FUNG|nr:hypothetical protein HK100_006579 [Physocladia obscura]
MTANVTTTNANATTTTALLGVGAERGPDKTYAVLGQSPYRRRCQDAAWIVPFAALLAFVALFGVRGARLVTNTQAYCGLVAPDALDAAALPVADPTTAAAVYAGCVHYIVTGSLSAARSNCLVFAINSLALNSTSTGGTTTAGTTTTRATTTTAGTTSTSTSISTVTTTTATSVSLSPSPSPSPAISRRQSSALSPQVVLAFSLCTSLLAANSPNAPESCLQYGIGSFLNQATATSSSAFKNVFSTCLQPALSTSPSAAIDSCADSAIDSLIAAANASSTVSSLSIFSNCLKSSSASTSAIEQCVSSALSPHIPTSDISTFISSCIGPSISADVSAIPSCVSSSFSALLASNTASSSIAQAVDTCITPFINGSTNALNIASSCLEFGLTKVLGGTGDQIFNLIEEGVSSLLGGDLAKTFSQSCLVQTVGDLTAGKGFDLQSNCLFQGLAQEFCADVVSAVTDSIANGISSYFTSFRDRVAQNAGHLAGTFLFIVVAGVAMAMVWMSVLILFGEGLIQFSIATTLINLTVLMIINFIILNIPIAVILLIYLIFKIGWFIFIWKRIRFVSILLRVTVAHLRRNPGAFILAAFLFIWNAAWSFLFACAYLEIYSPNSIPNPHIMTFAIVVLVLGFFWAFEVWKGVLGVSVAGSLGTWYYQSRDDDAGEKPVKKSAILKSFGHAVTLSFGSICLSSLFLAVLKTAHYFYKKAKNSRSLWVKAIVNALFGWMDYLLKTFDLYALVRVGIHYEPYLVAAKTTWGLISQQGLDALINDDCIETVTSSTSLLGSITLGSIAFITSKIVFKLDWDITLMCVFVSLLFGFAMLSIMGVTVEMGVVALFVCLAEDGEVLIDLHPRECKVLVEALVERCRERGWKIPGEVEILEERIKQTGF